MDATNDHERAIVHAVNQKLLERPKDRASIIRDVAGSLEFDMTQHDSEFLVSYVRWRLNHPTSEANAR
jgi:hypothetical protein